jgi:hypothetical protein
MKHYENEKESTSCSMRRKTLPKDSGEKQQDSVLRPMQNEDREGEKSLRLFPAKAEKQREEARARMHINGVGV